MGFLRSQKIYDRKQILANAERARSKGRRRRAIALYRRVLAAEPHDADLHTRIAPLLAQTGQHFDAWQSYRRAARARLSNNQTQEALQLYREAATALPRQIDAWTAIASLERRQGRNKHARDALLEGRQFMTGRRRRPEAIALLRSALDLDANDPHTTVDLARLLHRSRQTPEALELLDQLAARSTGAELRKARGAQWRVLPSLRHSWYWIRAAFGSRGSIPSSRRRAAAG